MDRDRIKVIGSHHPINKNDVYSILGIVFDWIEKQKHEAQRSSAIEPSSGDTEELEDQLRNAGYYFE